MLFSSLYAGLPTGLSRRCIRIAAAMVCGVGLMASAHATDPAPAVLDEGRALFQKGAVPACAVCHTLEDAGATGAIGPDLDDLRPNHQQVLAILRDGSGPMPSFSDSLSEEQREAVATYVVWATGGQ